MTIRMIDIPGLRRKIDTVKCKQTCQNIHNTFGSISQNGVGRSDKIGRKLCKHQQNANCQRKKYDLFLSLQIQDLI